MTFELRNDFLLGGYAPGLPLPAISSGDVVASDEAAMVLALRHGMNGSGISNPNPSVGCVITQNGKVIALGATEAYKQRHAERVAIDALSSTECLKDSVAYLTLEPCSHFGHQPPCVDLLIQKKISKVFIATQDLNPKVNGEGIAKLRSHGIAVEVGLLRNEAILWHFPFLAHQLLGRPIYIGKWAQSSNGLLATDEGESKWITSAGSRAYGHWLRQKYDAIAVGANTVMKDLPQLTARDCAAPIRRQPLRIILDPRGRIQTISKEMMANTFSKDATTILLGPQAEPPTNFPKKDHFISLRLDPLVSAFQSWVSSDVATAIFGKPIQSVYVEGGAKLLNLFLEAQSFDALHIFTGKKALSGSQHKVPSPLSTGRFSRVSQRAIENDVLEEFIQTPLLSQLVAKK